MKFPTTAQRRRGLGPVKKGNAYGVLVHAMIAVDAPTGACLGLVGGEVWTRDGVTAIYHMLKDGTEHRDLGADHFGRRPTEVKAKRLVGQLAKLGFEVELRPLAKA